MNAIKKFSILCFGNRWDEYERRDYSIMSRLGRYDNVDYILMIDQPLTLTSLVRYFFKKADDEARRGWDRIFKHGFMLRIGKIYIISSVLILPFYENMILRKINTSLLNIWRFLFIHYYIKKLHIGNFLVWVSGPENISEYFVKEYSDKFLCYNLCEDYTAKYKKSSNTYRILREQDIYLTKMANIIFVATTLLYNEKSKINKSVFLVTNGVDYDFFNKIRNEDSRIAPKDLENIRKPILMNVGILSDRTNLDFIGEIAKERMNWSIVHIGPEQRNNLKIEELKKCSNIHFLGPKPARDIPRYLKYTDACMLTYKVNYQNRSGSSMRLFLYLASGKPVIAFNVGGAENFSSIINLVETKEEFINAMDGVLGNDTPEMTKKRLEIAEKNSWDRKVEQVFSAITINMSL
jgi:glycosyltransferase involved in cell wall biosynthesis